MSAPTNNNDIYSRAITIINDLLLRFSEERVQSILEESGQFGENFAKARAPVLTGYLRDNIGHETQPNSLKLYSNADYSGFVDEGTVKMSAQPFMTPASLAVEEKLRNDLKSL